MSPAASQNGSGVFNLDKAAAAARAEAVGGEPFRFSFKGRAYSLLPVKAWPVQAQADLAGGRFDAGLSALISRRDYEQLARDGIIQAELEVLFEQVGRENGLVDLPNSSAPAQPASTRT